MDNAKQFISLFIQSRERGLIGPRGTEGDTGG